jgi:maleylacetate reductase
MNVQAAWPTSETDGRDFVHDTRTARVVFSAGSRHGVPGRLRDMGLRRVLLIGGPGSLGEATEDLAAGLGEILAARITDTAPHVPGADVDTAVALAREVSADSVVAFGGGSTTGLGKLVALANGIPLICLPTTYAGSEMTDIWGRTDDSKKATGRDARVRPALVVYDVELTLDLPPRLTALSGLNALAHCIEASYDASASPVTRLLAIEGARALAIALPPAVADGHDVLARTRLLYGAWLAGTALGSANMGVHHHLCHILGGTFGLPHAETHAALLPYSVAFNMEAAANALGLINCALGGEEGCAAAAWKLGQEIGAPGSLAELGLTRADALRAAEKLSEHKMTNPRVIDREGAIGLLLAAHAGGRPNSVPATAD